VAVLPAGHPLAARPHATLEQLAAEPFVLSRGGCERLILDTFRAAGHAPQVAFEVHEVSTIVAMVAEGLGVGLVPELSAVGAPSRVALRPLSPRVERRLGLAVPSLADAPPAVRALLDVAELMSQQLDNQGLGMP
jgi:DNA-binding transcriptional LysR family regulator